MTKGRPNKEETLQVRLTTAELEKLRRYADLRGLSASRAVRDWIRRLPNEQKPPEKTLPSGGKIIRRFNTISKVTVPIP